VEWVVREGVGAGGEMTQALYAHRNNKRKEKKIKRKVCSEHTFVLSRFTEKCTLGNHNPLNKHAVRSGV
jgi:hypothetical protein